MSAVFKPKAKGQGFSKPKSPRNTSRSDGQRTPSSQAELEQQALDFSNQGKPRKAEAIYRALIAAGSTNHLTYSRLALIYGKEQRHLEAVSLLRQALTLEPCYAEGHYNLGVALHLLGDYKGATSSFQSALKFDPDNADIHNSLAVVLKKQGLLNEAIESYNNAIAIEASNPNTYNNLGIALNEKGKTKAAIEALERAISLNPTDADMHNNLGRALSEEGLLAEAIASYTKALEINPRHSNALSNLGEAWKNQGRLDKAIAIFREAIECNANITTAIRNLIAIGNMEGLALARATIEKQVQAEPTLLSNLHFIESIASLGPVFCDRILHCGTLSED